MQFLDHIDLFGKPLYTVYVSYITSVRTTFVCSGIKAEVKAYGYWGWRSAGVGVTYRQRATSKGLKVEQLSQEITNHVLVYLN
jgi:hypothetical protein